MRTFDDEAEMMAIEFAKVAHKALKSHEAQMKKVNGDKVDYLFWDNCEFPLRESILSTIPLAELLRDKARLDWIRGKLVSEVVSILEENNDGKTLRQAIDAAIKEEKK